MEQNLSNIIKGCANNNILMQKALYSLCYDDMMKVCNRYTNQPETSASIYNDAMFKVLNNIAGYREEGKIMGWVKRIVINLNLIFLQ